VRIQIFFFTFFFLSFSFLQVAIRPSPTVSKNANTGATVYVVGGMSGGTPVCGMAWLDTNTQQWSVDGIRSACAADAQNSPPALRGLSAVFWGGVNEAVYVFGGLPVPAGAPNSKVFKYVPRDDAWNAPVELGRGYYRGAAVAGADRIYLFGGTSGSGALSNALEAYDPNTNALSTLVGDSAPPPPGTAEPALHFYNGFLYVLAKDDSVFRFNTKAPAWLQMKRAESPAPSRGRAAIGAYPLPDGADSTVTEVVVFGGAGAPFSVTDNSVQPTVKLSAPANAPLANASYQFAILNGEFSFVTHGGVGAGGTADATLRVVKLRNVGACAARVGALSCVPPDVCWNTLVAPFQACTRAPGVTTPDGSTAAPSGELFLCLNEKTEARDKTCSDGATVRSLERGTRLGPFSSMDALPLGCDGKRWLPLANGDAQIFVPITAASECKTTIFTPAPPASSVPMIGSLPLATGAIAIAIGGGGALMCIIIALVCLVRNCKRGAGDGGADERSPSAIEMRTSQQGTLKAAPSSSTLGSSQSYGGATDSFPEYSTGASMQSIEGRGTVGMSSGYHPTDQFAKAPSVHVNLASSIIERQLLTIKGEIGRGAYGVVCKGDYRGVPVAIKAIGEDMSDKDRRDFEQEAVLLQKLPPHDNVVRFIGVSYEGQKIMIVLEYLAGGSLIDLLESSIKIGRPQIVDWLRGVAAGMVHLRNHNIIHRDLAARNVLLGPHGEPKVSDFGMSRFVANSADAQHVTASSVGPLKWMSPQSLLDKAWNEKSDVWAFGVLMYEVIAREEPYADLEPVQVAAQVCRDGITLEPPNTFGDDLVDLLHSCMRWEETGRPTFRQIHAALQAMNRIQ
jgi:predicted Ser/Thr protein kinase